MAYENINFQSGNQMALEQQRQLLNAIGQGIGNYQNQQNLDMQRRQIEMKANQVKPVDFQQIAMEAVYKKQMGIPTTPQEDAAIGVMAQTKSDQTYIDPNTGQAITRPNPWRSLMGPNQQIADAPAVSQSSFAGLPNTPESAGAQGQATNPAMTRGYGDIQPLFSGESPPSQSMAVPQLEVRGNPREMAEIRDANIDLRKLKGEKQVESYFKGMELKEKEKNKQKNFEDKLLEYTNELGGLIEAGTYKESLPDNATISDVMRNLSASIQASDIGRAAGGAVGTQTSTAMSKMESTHPLIFGELRDLLGMTGRELDTRVEQDYYKGIIPKGDKEITSALETLNELSLRFGTGDAAARIEELKKRVSDRKSIRQMSPEDKLKRYQELLRKRDGK